MTAPTVEQLRTPQPEDPTFTINREKVRTLNHVDQDRVRRSDGGHDVLAAANGGTGYGSRIRIVDLWKAGLVVLDDTNHQYRLTDAGRRRRREATDEYDRNSVGGAPTTRPAPAKHP